MSVWLIVLMAWLGGAFPLAVLVGRTMAHGAGPALMDLNPGDAPAPLPMPPAMAS